MLTPEQERRRHALFQEHLGEVLAEHDKAVPEEPDKTEEWVSPIEDRWQVGHPVPDSIRNLR